MVNTIDIVVARYNEDVSWIDTFRSHTGVSIFLYNKSADTSPCYKKLKNIGREAHTFLYHIFWHYEHLADRIMLLQGNPFDHESDIERYHELIVCEMGNKEECVPISRTHDVYCDRNGRPHHLMDLRLDEIFKTLFGVSKPIPKRYQFSPGAQYVVTRDTIHRHPKQFWYKLLVLSESDPQFPWKMERLWRYVFSDITPEL